MERFWLLLLSAVVILVCWGPSRRFLLTRFIMSWFKNVLPAISETEQAAIDAGDVWWEGSLFRGKPDWKQLHQWPIASLSAEEQSFMQLQVAHLCRLIDDWEITNTREDLAPALWKYLKHEGFFGMIIPKQYGGLGFSARMHSEVIAAITTRSLSVAVTTMVPNSLGPAELLLHYGTTEQKDYYLPRLAKGEEIPCFALTGPEAGSDAGSMPDTGILLKKQIDGQTKIMIELTWNKRYITLAPVATVLGLAFKLKDPEHLLGQQVDLGITLCLIPTNHPGVEIGNRHFPLNAVFMNGPTSGTKVLIPLDWIIGGSARIGQGWRMLMECLSAGRGISLPALSAAMGAVCFRGTSAYAQVRRQFKKPIGQFEGVAQSLARIGGLQYALNAVRIFTVMGIDQGAKPAVASAIAKYHMTEWARVIINDAMDIHGGRGIMLGPKNYLGRYYQAMPISITVEGANILTRNLIIFGQGAIRCHPYVLAEIKASQNPNVKEGLKAFDKSLMAHIGYTTINKIRALFFGFTRASFACVPKGLVFKKYYKRANWMSAVLSVLADLAMLILGGTLKRREALSARLGDVLSHLYFITAVLHYFYHQGQPKEEEIYVDWVCQFLFKEIEITILGFLDNFPIKIVGKLLRYGLFPIGTGFSLPKDTLTHALAAHMQTQSSVRDQLTKVCSPGGELSVALKLVEDAFQKLLVTSVIAKKSDRNVEEAAELRSAEDLRSEAIQVDEFSK